MFTRSLTWIEIAQGLTISQFRLLMKRRREHMDCESREGGRGCIVLGTPVCTLKKKKQTRWAVMRRWIWSLAVLNAAICYFVFIAAVAIGIGTGGITTDFRAYLAPVVEQSASP